MTEKPLLLELTTPNGHTYEQRLGLFINTEFGQGTGAPITAMDPAYVVLSLQWIHHIVNKGSTEIEIASVAAASLDDVDRAVKCARKALQSDAWKLLPGFERGKLLLKLADLMEHHKEVLASVVPLRMLTVAGLPYTSALGEDVPGGIDAIRYFAGWADKMQGQALYPTPQQLAYTLRQPIAVVAQIIHWNSPIMMAGWKLGPALAYGNAVVLKAAEQTPLSILLLARLVREAGLPPSVVDLLNGRGAEAGAGHVEHPLVDRVTFTGSAATARNGHDRGGAHAQGRHAGDGRQVAAARLRRRGPGAGGQVGAGRRHGVLGPDLYVDESYPRRPEGVPREGAQMLAGGSACPVDGKGYFLQPTVLVDVEPSMAIYRDEISGPVGGGLLVRRRGGRRSRRPATRTTGSARPSSRGTWSARTAWRRRSRRAWSGSIVARTATFACPFGGVKQSGGIGRELGEAGLEAYTQVKAVHVNMGMML
ncbi:aldehyde dehydrogenase [Cordyceps fumosorosea ARSEF 2679]|uniref:aldehyde dehydrogenase (NAD(+)) n=1 Tax=Cordyceps fumosorosea (strain ARSEF 2679) TaxID=1081104 RepID=A0A167LD16_CORFA|nr:aldehyde dehydrogenase [Cordyceps fumosorosea ARSEF 2679]OAA52946.1 aldehyde dehydrogenase [Cordyceps fumosorosea ARSEF 2679]